MKEEHNTITADTIINTEAMISDQDTIKYPVILSLLPILAVFVAILQGVLCHVEVVRMAKTGVVTLILTGAVMFYIRLYALDIMKKRLAGLIIALGYLISLGLLLFIPQSDLINFWMIGGLITAMLLDNKLGLILNVNLVFILGISSGVHLQNLIQLSIICILISLLSKALKLISTFVYAVIIILSVNVTLTCAINNFILEKITHINYLYSLLSLLSVLICAFVLFVLYNRNADEEGSKVNADSGLEIKEVLPEIISESDISQPVSEISKSSAAYQEPDPRTSYEILCNPDNRLLLKLREFSISLYEHAQKIADLSGRAAEQIGADDMLARAGGLYHEIGKPNGTNYIEEGLKLAAEYSFPKELTAIIREHNIKYDKPSSVEAAIVMISDSVVSTIDYIAKTGDRKFTSDKIIENIFQMRLDKGTFDSAGISLKDYKTLKEFYLAQFKEKVPEE